ncbi:Xenobiotic-transporting ATPase [Actinobacteria bacterium OK074]|nr:Xenobiotic-transporting ATPase [Actinobacteria bacterium OK074]
MTDAHPGRPTPRLGGPPYTVGTLLAPVRPKIVAATLLSALSAVVGLVPFAAVYLLARELSHAEPDHTAVWTIVGVTLGAAVARFLIGGLAVTLAHGADTELQTLLRRTMAERLSRAPLGWLGERGSGRVKATLQDDVEEMHYLVAHALPDLAVAVAAPVAAVCYLATIDWRLTLLNLVGIPVYYATFKIMVKISTPRIPAIGAAMGRLNAAVVEFVQGIAVVKAFGQARRAHDRFAKAADDYLTAFTAANGPILRVQSVNVVVIAPATTLLIVALSGTLFAGQGWIAPIDVVPFLTLGLGLTAPVLALGLATNALRSARAAAGRVGELLAVEPLPETAEPRQPAGHDVEFRDVTFGYDADAPVLHDVSARLAAGTVTALVGPSGSGKSTLASLVLRFADPQRGQVLIGGTDVRDIASAELYRHVGFVLQDVNFLRTTISDNLRLAVPEATDEELAAACKAVGIHDRILRLPRGYDSVVGDDAKLSGGEAQRLSIARVLLADTPVVVLDEATAHADPESESALQEALSRLIAGRTVLVIAHRLGSVTAADRILVLDEGRIAEQGTHPELLAREGLYASLWATERRHIDTTTAPVTEVNSR